MFADMHNIIPEWNPVPPVQTMWLFLWQFQTGLSERQSDPLLPNLTDQWPCISCCSQNHSEMRCHTTSPSNFTGASSFSSFQMQLKTYPLFSNPTNLSSCKVTTKSTVFITNIHCFLTLYGEDGNNTTENYDVFSIPSIINMTMIPVLAFTSALYVTLISCLQSYIVQLYDI